MERTPAGWHRRSPRGYPSPRAPSPSILRSGGGGDRRLSGVAQRRRVDVGGERQTRKVVREYDPRSRPTHRQAAAKASSQETREWKKHMAQTGRAFERSLRKTSSGGETSPGRRSRSASPYARSASPYARSAGSPSVASPHRRSPSSIRDMTRRAANPTRVHSSLRLPRRRVQSSTRAASRSPSPRRQVVVRDSPRAASRSPSPRRQVVVRDSPRAASRSPSPRRQVVVRDSPRERASRSPSPRRQAATDRRVSQRVVAPRTPLDKSIPCIGLEIDDEVTFLASWKIPRPTTAGPGGVADPELDVQIMQFDMNGNQIEGGLLDSRHPRTEWKNPVRTSPYFSAWRDQGDRETDPWHVTATHSGDRRADGGGWQTATIELSSVAPNVHSIYVVVRTRNGLTLNFVDPEQLEITATSDSAGGSVRRLPCELPALALARRTDCAVVARLVCTREHRRYRDTTGNIVENMIEGWGCQPLPLAVEPFRGLPQHNTLEKAHQRAVDAIHTFLRDEAATESPGAVPVRRAVHEVIYDDGRRPNSPTRILRSHSRSPRRELVVARGGADGLFDLGVSTPVRCVGRWQHTAKPLDLSALMFGWNNRFLPDTHVDRNRPVIEWCVDEARPEWTTAAKHSGDSVSPRTSRSASQEIMVFPDDVSHAVQAVFFVLAPRNQTRLEQLRGGNAKFWQGPTLLHSFECGSYVGMATSMVLGAMIRSDPTSPWQFHALDIACFGEGHLAKRRQWEAICEEWLDSF